MLSLRYHRGWVLDLWQGRPEDFDCDLFFSEPSETIFVDIAHQSDKRHVVWSSSSNPAWAHIFEHLPFSEKKRRLTFIVPLDQEFSLWQNGFFASFA